MGDAICSSCLLQFLGITDPHGHLTLFSCHHMLMVLERVSMVTSVLEFLCRLCLPLRSAHGNTEPFCIHCSPRASSLWAIAVASAQRKEVWHRSRRAAPVIDPSQDSQLRLASSLPSKRLLENTFRNLDVSPNLTFSDYDLYNICVTL